MECCSRWRAAEHFGVERDYIEILMLKSLVCVGSKSTAKLSGCLEFYGFRENFNEEVMELKVWG
jgi:hypothetical protein